MPEMEVSPAQSRRGVLLVALAATLWGTVGITTSTLYRISAANALSVSFFRLALAAPVLLVVTWLTLGPQGLRAHGRRDFWLMLGTGAAMASYQVCYFAAIARLGVSVAVIIALCSCPVMVALLSIPLLKERLTSQVLLALVLAISGTVLLVSGSTGATLIEILLALGAGLSYALVTMGNRALAGRYHPLQPISISFVAGSLMLLPFALAGGLVLTYPPNGWLLLLYQGLVPTALSYVLFVSGLRTTSATVASILTLLEPLTSTVLAWWLFKERLGPLGVFGAALLLGAMVILFRGERQPKQAQALC